MLPEAKVITERKVHGQSEELFFSPITAGSPKWLLACPMGPGSLSPGVSERSFTQGRGLSTWDATEGPSKSHLCPGGSEPSFSPTGANPWLYTFFHYQHERACDSSIAQPCLTLCNPVDCSPPGSSVHGILQATVLEWIAIVFSRGSSRNPGIEPMFPALAGRSFTTSVTWEAHMGTIAKRKAGRGLLASPSGKLVIVVQI